ncbi:glycoside hydrolase family 5 protein [Rheinheimera sediminis]|uniref:glycoside hydrolase family 5 protein n=1 Tax=Rheinheimera sp. YQF-1 TaxID=2499626 RepID=UPI001C970AEA|nr:glycoside hydrolase family 5 protein [Rheinheimera sp. YQF-1]
MFRLAFNYAKYVVLLLTFCSLHACSGNPNSPSVQDAASTGSVQQQFSDYNTNPAAPDKTGMSSTARELASRIRIGLNKGNTLEAVGNQGEKSWGNPAITADFIALAKKSGFNAIRLPVSWDQYADQSTAAIDPAWQNRIKQVVQYCIDNDLYVLVNIHWDGGWLERNVTPEKQQQVNARQKAYWQQIATLLRDFDERLIFASANEPHAENAEQMAVLLSYHQTFIDTVRATGGKNSYRTLVVQGPSTDIEKTRNWMHQLPEDPTKDRMMLELHYYSPYNFTLMADDASWGKAAYYWGKDFMSDNDSERNASTDEDYVDQMFSSVKKQFVDAGIPVILGEFGADIRGKLTGDERTRHLNSRAHYFNYVTKSAIAHGLVPFYWDTGSLLDRRQNKVLDQQALNALMSGSSAFK